MKKLYQNENGAISAFAMFAMMFFLVVIAGVYMISSKRAQTQTESLQIVQNKYYTEGEENEKYDGKIAKDADKIPIYTKEQLWSIGTNKAIEIEGKVYDFSKTDLAQYELKNDIVINLESDDLKKVKLEQSNGYQVYYCQNEEYYVKSDIPADLTKDNYYFKYANLSKALGYVEEGLMVHYDGIKNTAIGHNNSTTTWKDLSGNGNDGTLKDCTWEDKNLRLNNAFSGIVGQYKDNLKLTDFTLEMTLESYTSDSNGAVLYDFHTSGNSGFFAKISNNSLTVAFGNTRYEYSYDFLNASFPINMVLRCNKSNGKYEIMMNGHVIYSYVGNIDIEKSTSALFGILNNDECNEGAYYGKLNNFMLYNRALADEEIQQNYEVDKVRFGIE